MAIGMGPQGLINQRARLRGDRGILKAERIKKVRETERLQSLLAGLQGDLSALDQQIETLTSDIDVLTQTLAIAFNHANDDELGRKTYPKSHITGWGNLTRQILAILRDGLPKSADVIAIECAEALGNCLSDSDSWKVFRRQIGRILKNMYSRGLLTRHHPSQTGISGIWSLKAIAG